MKIMLAGSFSNAKKILALKKQLETAGHEILTTSDIELYAKTPKIKTNFSQELKHCVEYDSMKDGFNQVVDSDAVLVCNYTKNNIKGYLGTSVLMELAVAYYHNKNIFFLNDYDKTQNYGLEISIINPTIINNDLSQIE